MSDELRIVKHDESGATLGYYLLGGTIVSWSPSGGTSASDDNPGRASPDDVYFVSSKAIYKEGKAIRGGIPIAFPQFAGDGSLPNHGFARTAVWSEEVAANGELVLTFSDNDHTRSLWDFPFKLELRVSFTATRCHTMLTVTNTGSAAIDFQALLHTYYFVDSIADVGVRGLKGLTYLDKVKEFKEFELQDEDMPITSETDRIFVTAAKGNESDGSIDIVADGAVVRHLSFWGEQGENADALTEKKPVDAVVWNPWADKAASMGDFGDEEYKTMVCVEPGCVKNRVNLPQGHTFRLNQVVDIIAS